MHDSPALRLFIALWPDPRMRAALAAQRDAWAWPPGAAPVRDDNLHATLHFLGAVAAGRVAALRTALALPFERFVLERFEPKLWPGGLAVLEGETPPALAALHARLADALRALDLAVETRPYRPHVTLARRAQRARVPTTRAMAWPVDGYALVASAGGRYTVLERYG
jgi:2'-5' RNA ligase